MPKNLDGERMVQLGPSVMPEEIMEWRFSPVKIRKVDGSIHWSIDHCIVNRLASKVFPLPLVEYSWSQVAESAWFTELATQSQKPKMRCTDCRICKG